MIIFSVGYAVHRERKGQIQGEQRQITIEAANALEAASLALEQIAIATGPDHIVTTVKIGVAIDHDTTRMRRANA